MTRTKYQAVRPFETMIFYAEVEVSQKLKT